MLSILLYEERESNLDNGFDVQLSDECESKLYSVFPDEVTSTLSSESSSAVVDGLLALLFLRRLLRQP